METWVPKHFATSLRSLAKQVLPKHIYNKYGVIGLRYMDHRILITIDELRKNLNKPITVNGGIYNASGYRDYLYYGTPEKYSESSSQHKYGRALDFRVKGMKAWEVRKHILENKELYPYISFIEVGPLSDGDPMGWVHIDCRMYPVLKSGDTISCWSPNLSYVSESTVIGDKL